MITTVDTSITFAGLTAVLDFGRKGVKEAMIFVPTLTTDNYLTVSVSYDGVTYLTLEENDGAVNEMDVVINSARCRRLRLAGCRYITLTAPATAQTVTVYAIAVPY